MKSSKMVLVGVSALLLGSGSGILVDEALRTPVHVLERQHRVVGEQQARLSKLIEEAEALIRSANEVDPAVQVLVSARAAALARSLHEEFEATSAQSVSVDRMIKTLRALEFLDRTEKGR